MPNLRRFVQFHNPAEAYYFGAVTLHRWKEENLAFNLGTYVMSRGALRRAAHVLRHMPSMASDAGYRWGHHCVDRPGAGEDPTFSMCLRAAGVAPFNTLDRRLRQRFLPFRHNDHVRAIDWPKQPKEELWKDFVWAGKPKRAGVLSDCCSDELIAAHNYGGADGRAQWRDLAVRFAANGAATVPPPPQCFLYDEDMVPRSAVDARRAVRDPTSPHARDQVIFDAAGELECPPPRPDAFLALAAKG